MTTKILLSWIGSNDIRSVPHNEADKMGSIRRVLSESEREYDFVYLFNNYKREEQFKEGDWTGTVEQFIEKLEACTPYCQKKRNLFDEIFAQNSLQKYPPEVS